MDFSTWMSQLTFVCAGVLVASGATKILELLRPGKVQSSSPNAPQAMLHSLMSHKFLLLAVSLVEISLGIGASITTNTGSDSRNAIVAAMALLLAIFTGLCMYMLVTKSTAPCHCFGSLSQSRVRASQCVRNAALTGICIGAMFAEPEPLTSVGVVLTIVVLGGILFDEIR